MNNEMMSPPQGINTVQLDKVYHGDCETMMNAFKDLKVCIVTDPPYNVGYHYDGYEDNLDEYDYLSLLRFIIGSKPAVVLHYSESIHKLSIALNRAPERCVSYHLSLTHVEWHAKRTKREAPRYYTRVQAVSVRHLR